MGIRQFKPVTSATRFRSVSDFAEVTKTEPERSLVEPLTKTGGRNNKGHITTRWRGGGHKRRYRRLSFRREKVGVPATVTAVGSDTAPPSRVSPRPPRQREGTHPPQPPGPDVRDHLETGTGA